MPRNCFPIPLIPCNFLQSQCREVNIAWAACPSWAEVNDFRIYGSDLVTFGGGPFDPSYLDTPATDTRSPTGLLPVGLIHRCIVLLPSDWELLCMEPTGILSSVIHTEGRRVGCSLSLVGIPSLALLNEDED